MLYGLYLLLMFAIFPIIVFTITMLGLYLIIKRAVREAVIEAQRNFGMQSLIENALNEWSKQREGTEDIPKETTKICHKCHRACDIDYVECPFCRNTTFR